VSEIIPQLPHLVTVESTGRPIGSRRLRLVIVEQLFTGLLNERRTHGAIRLRRRRYSESPDNTTTKTGRVMVRNFSAIRYKRPCVVLLQDHRLSVVAPDIQNAPDITAYRSAVNARRCDCHRETGPPRIDQLDLDASLIA